MTIQKRLRLTLLAALCLAMCLCTTAFADTDGTEPKITQQPDQLVLQLGTRWAGMEFELRTDAGVFPAPIVVDETGVLTMDLGGSTTYTLSCINSTVPIPSLTRPQSRSPIPSSSRTAPPSSLPDRYSSRRSRSPPESLPASPSLLWWCFSSASPAGSAALWPSTWPSGAASRPTTTSGRRRMRSSIDRQKPPQTEIKSPRLRWAKKWRKSRQNIVFSLTICWNPVIISL